MREVSALYKAGYTVSQLLQRKKQAGEDEKRKQNRAVAPEPQNFGLSFAWAIAGEYLRYIKKARKLEAASRGEVCQLVNSVRPLGHGDWLSAALGRDNV